MSQSDRENAAVMEFVMHGIVILSLVGTVLCLALVSHWSSENKNNLFNHKRFIREINFEEQFHKQAIKEKNFEVELENKSSQSLDVGLHNNAVIGEQETSSDSWWSSTPKLTDRYLVHDHRVPRGLWEFQ